MFYLMIAIFIIGYTLIALEHPIKINKSATALKLGVILWVCIAIAGEALLVDSTAFKHYLEEEVGGSFIRWLVHHELLTHLGEISEILFFLLGAMTIVEMVDSFHGFRLITDKIKTTKRSKLLWILSVLTFFMSATLDNLTTSIVMVALLRKLIADKKDRWFFAGMVIIAANAGGAWSPIGDVTTIMLWIAGKVTTGNIIVMTIIPSMVSMVVPLLILTFTMKGNVERPEMLVDQSKFVIPKSQSNAIFFIGVLGLLFVPVFKTVFHLPPYLGMMFSLGVLWTVTEILNSKRAKMGEGEQKQLTIVGVLQKVDVPSVLFFLGILLAVSALATAGHLMLLADVLRVNIGNLYVINIIIGILSAIVDNVPLVAGAMGMYSFLPDHYFWMFLAYCAGTGGSILIIGSAAGVAVMGMEKIDFIWYMKRLSILALVGYLAGAATYIVQEESGILRGEDVSEYVVNIQDEEQVIYYLTHNEFFHSEDKDADHSMHADGQYLYFIKFDDVKNHELFMGYQLKTIEHGEESWEGKLVRDKVIFSKEGPQKIRIETFGKVFMLDSDGVLIEVMKGKNGIDVMKPWKRMVQEE